jgi:hypothetical protein
MQSFYSNREKCTEFKVCAWELGRCFLSQSWIPDSRGTLVGSPPSCSFHRSDVLVPCSCVSSSHSWSPHPAPHPRPQEMALSEPLVFPVSQFPIWPLAWMNFCYMKSEIGFLQCKNEWGGQHGRDCQVVSGATPRFLVCLLAWKSFASVSLTF